MMRMRSSARATERVVRALAPVAALVWILAGPPIENGAPQPDAPRDVWTRYGMFKTEGECGRAKEFMGRVTGKGKYRWEEIYWERLARCTSTEE
jgi:hypothetical protein